MNLYFLLEGEKTEKKVYQRWLSSVFPRLVVVDRIEEVSEDHIRLLSGDGYPQILSRIEEALAEIAGTKFDHFFICLDAEEDSAAARREAVRTRLVTLAPELPTTIIVQDCCIETWFLGNRVFVPAQPQGAELVAFRSFFDVRSEDPERMPTRAPFETRQAFHQQYWKQVFREVFRGKSVRYSKSDPVEVGEPHYFQQLVHRIDQTDHLGSFRALVESWRGLGAKIGATSLSEESR